MVRSVFALVLLAVPVMGLAADETAPPVSSSLAEYHRLAHDLQVLAARNAWSGVERTYDRIEATGVPMQFEELIAGAHSARVQGDTRAARDRLRAASRQREERDVLEWMWEIDQSYGQVFLVCEVVKKRQPELTRALMPFDPNHRRAVEFAIERLREVCLFDGLLPAGDYEFGHYSFTVHPHVESVSLDMRTGDAKTKKKDKEVAFEP